MTTLYWCLAWYLGRCACSGSCWTLLSSLYQKWGAASYYLMTDWWGWKFSYTFYTLVTLGWKWATDSHIWLPPIGDIRSVPWLSPWTSQATLLLISRGDDVKLVWYLESLLQVFGFIVSNIMAQIIHASLSLWIYEREYSIFVHDVDSRAELESQFHI